MNNLGKFMAFEKEEVAAIVVNIVIILLNDIF